MVKKCPLCGNDAVEEIEFGRDLMIMRICCAECGCNLEDEYSTGNHLPNSEMVIKFMESVKEQWNRRV